MRKRRVSVVIVDLDNTLWDWVDVWYRSFRAMLDQIVAISGIPEADLYGPISAVHQRHGTSEYAFLIEELEPLRMKHGPDADLKAIYTPAIEAYRQARRDALVLYPTVFETLWKFRDAGCLVIGYTESQEYYTNYRVRRLGLDGLLDYLYSPEDHDLPTGLDRDQIRRYREDTYRLKRTIHRHTPAGELKPNADVLRSILRTVGATPEQTIYIGDSEMKDIAMAQDCGVTDVFAKYGAANPQQYELLKHVTHWTPEDVAREQRIKTRGEVRPTYSLESCFAEVLTHFDFEPFAPNSSDRLAETIELWKKAVDVQQHFNDIELRIRNVAISLLVAVIGAAALLIRDQTAVTTHVLPAGVLAAGLLMALVLFALGKGRSRLLALLAIALGILVSYWVPPGPSVSIPLSTIVLAAGSVAWLAFYFMDKYWYHRLLRGAVDEASSLEKLIAKDVPSGGLTHAIGRRSPFEVRGRKVHSDDKMDWFYAAIFLLLFGLALLSSKAGIEPTEAAPSRAAPTMQPVSGQESTAPLVRPDSMHTLTSETGSEN